MASPTASASETDGTGSSSQRCSVLVRLKPLESKTSASTAAASCIASAGPSQLQFRGPGFQGGPMAFDTVLGPDAEQDRVFASCFSVCEAALAGYNACIMSYGQTGSGKTHTLVGDMLHQTQQQLGIIPRAALQLCQQMGQASNPGQLSCTVSCAEVYCERVRDLLADGDADQDLPITQDKAKGITIAALTETPFTTFAAVSSILGAALHRRSVAATGMNATSSRSHCIVTFLVSRAVDARSFARSKLQLVDLAGSERSDRTGAQGLTFEEGKLINKSLTALGKVVNVLAEGRPGSAQHVPYRDSKLTRALQDCLGGQARTMLIVCCAQVSHLHRLATVFEYRQMCQCMECMQDTASAAETLSSLRFAARARSITCTPQVQLVKSDLALQLEAALQELTVARAEAAMLKEELEEHKKQSALETAAKVACSPVHSDSAWWAAYICQIVCVILVILIEFLL